MRGYIDVSNLFSGFTVSYWREQSRYVFGEPVCVWIVPGTAA